MCHETFGAIIAAGGIEFGSGRDVMTAIDLNIAANGRMVLPKAVREAMGLHGAAKVTLILDEDGVRLETPLRRLERARALYRQAVKTPRTTEDFLRDRRAEAKRENARFDRGHK